MIQASINQLLQTFGVLSQLDPSTKTRAETRTLKKDFKTSEKALAESLEGVNKDKDNIQGLLAEERKVNQLEFLKNLSESHSQIGQKLYSLNPSQKNFEEYVRTPRNYSFALEKSSEYSKEKVLQMRAEREATEALQLKREKLMKQIQQQQGLWQRT